VELDPLSRVRPGDKAHIWLDTSRIHLFDPQSGDNLTRTTGSNKYEAITTG
jgi:multiple sugar transport system ATP-binding protein